MKLSDKILLVFFGFLFLYLTAVFAEVRVTGIPNFIDEKNSISESADLPNISYLIIDDVNKSVKVSTSDRPRLEVRSLAGNVLKELTYKISGDTMKLSGFEAEELKKIKITVFVPADVRGIAVKSSVVVIEGLQQSHLAMTQNSGRVWMSDCKIANIDVDLSDRSFLEITNSKVNTLSAAVDASEVLMFSPAALVKGAITNTSFLRLAGEVEEIQLKKDITSNLSMYK